ncbi:MAG: amidophosphoribosyltransferase [Bacillota bacterium]|jgi:amidophosphoribosyltransferase|nr:amidophosphoribosyltransferase [Candidatus Fermentithermobacillaceae bacterium]
MSGEVREECGVFAVTGHPRAVELCYYGLFALQHRGQESAGIAWRQGSRLRVHKGMGLVSDVFPPELVTSMKGDMALGHVRYSTTGDSSIENAQPLGVKMWRGQVALAHNGNLTNAAILRRDLEREGSIFQTTADTEVIPHLVAKSGEKDMLDAFRSALDEVRGAYSLVALTPESLIAAKDPMGFRPLCLGKLDGAYVISSETCGLDAVGAEFVREVEPGEMVEIMFPIESKDRQPALRTVLREKSDRQYLCAFEFIYFARPDSDIYGLNVHRARKHLGRRLARKDPIEADLVTGVPDSSLSAASGFAEEAGIPFETGLVKNRYIGRTFISPEQSLRELAVKIKLNPLRSLLKGKRVVLVDDSIVRGTTSRYIVGLLRSAGAKEVHVRISSPPYRYPCYYGIDTSSKGELAAASMTVEEVREAIGADSLVFLDLDDLYEVLGTATNGLCYSCFTGDYPVPIEGCPKGGCKQ